MKINPLKVFNVLKVVGHITEKVIEIVRKNKECAECTNRAEKRKKKKA